MLVEESDSDQYHQRRCGRSNCGGSYGRKRALHDVAGTVPATERAVPAAGPPGGASPFPPYLGRDVSA